MEALDFALAQAILDGANVTLPHGVLTDAYDELGGCPGYWVSVGSADWVLASRLRVCAVG